MAPYTGHRLPHRLKVPKTVKQTKKRKSKKAKIRKTRKSSKNSRLPAKAPAPSSSLHTRRRRVTRSSAPRNKVSLALLPKVPKRNRPRNSPNTIVSSSHVSRPLQTTANRANNNIKVVTPISVPTTVPVSVPVNLGFHPGIHPNIDLGSKEWQGANGFHKMPHRGPGNGGPGPKVTRHGPRRNSSGGEESEESEGAVSSEEDSTYEDAVDSGQTEGQEGVPKVQRRFWPSWASPRQLANSSFRALKRLAPTAIGVTGAAATGALGNLLTNAGLQYFGLNPTLANLGTTLFRNVENVFAQPGSAGTSEIPKEFFEAAGAASDIPHTVGGLGLTAALLYPLIRRFGNRGGAKKRRKKLRNVLTFSRRDVRVHARQRPMRQKVIYRPLYVHTLTPATAPAQPNRPPMPVNFQDLFSWLPLGPNVVTADGNGNVGATAPPPPPPPPPPLAFTAAASGDIESGHRAPLAEKQVDIGGPIGKRELQVQLLQELQESQQKRNVAHTLDNAGIERLVKQAKDSRPSPKNSLGLPYLDELQKAVRQRTLRQLNQQTSQIQEAARDLERDFDGLENFARENYVM